jgi:hypothetical protein
MGKVFDGIDPKLAGWIRAQPMFFVATAPLSADGLVNCSPKSLAGTFAVLDEHRVAYLDLTGSGVETIAHLRENGRIVLMFCAFEGRPRIVRLHGNGEPVFPGDARFDDLAGAFIPHPGARAIVLIDVQRVSDSCGYSVPLMGFVRDRDVLDKWTEHKGEDGLIAYRARKNAASLDGLPGLPRAPARNEN